MANKFEIFTSTSRDHSGPRYRWRLMAGEKNLCESTGSFESVNEALGHIKEMRKACTRFTKTEKNV